MDDATKQGYGMMMLEQGLPKSHFYAAAIARLKRDVARDVGPPVKPSDFDDDDLAGLGLQTDSSDGGDGGAA